MSQVQRPSTGREAETNPSVILYKILGSGIPSRPLIAPGRKAEAGSQDQQGLWDCCDTPTSGLSPAQRPQRGQASLAGDRWERSRQAECLARYPLCTDHKPLARQFDSPAPSETRLTDRQAQEDSPPTPPPHTPAHLGAGSSHLYSCVYSSPPPPTDWLFISLWKGSWSLQASPCFLLLAAL